MNKPYVKEFKLVDGKQILQNPIGPEGYINKDLNRKQRRNLMKPAHDNNRAGRHYYQRVNKITKDFVEISKLKDDGLEVFVQSKGIIVTPLNKVIKHRYNHLRKLSAF